MSLHLGNLSSHVRRDELERVFRKFGRCNVQVKDKYGFVVFDYPAGAEKALKTLRGKNICGEPISLSWSNKQPRHLQRHAHGSRSFVSFLGRQRETQYHQKMNSRGRIDNDRAFKEGDDIGGYADQVDEATNYHSSNMTGLEGEQTQPCADDFLAIGDGSETDLTEDDRWRAQGGNLSRENEMGFDRYDPFYDDGRKEDADCNATHLVAYGKSEDRKAMKQVDPASNKRRSQKGCYICGEVGHKMRRCPQGLNQCTSMSKGRPPLEADATLRRHKSEAESSRSKDSQKLLKHGDAQLSEVNHRGRRNDYWEKKRSRRECESPEAYSLKKARGPTSASMHSKHSASRSQSLSQSRSRSVRHMSRSSSDSRSKSIEPIENFPSNMRPVSSSQYSGSRSPKPRSVSRLSSPASLALPESLNTLIPSSPSKVHTEQKKCFVENASLEEEKFLVGWKPVLNGDERSNSVAYKSMKVVGGNEGTNVQVGANEIQYQSLCITHNNDINGVNALRESCTWKESSDLLAGDLSLNNFSIESGSQNNDCMSKDEVEVSLRPDAANPTSIGPEELFRVLKHYGLEQSEEDKDVPVETYFGSARLWPWDIIYYRRLKKGSISTENYARRIAQNRDFSIVDKYIRSSSGWGELSK